MWDEGRRDKFTTLPSLTPFSFSPHTPPALSFRQTAAVYLQAGRRLTAGRHCHAADWPDGRAVAQRRLGPQHGDIQDCAHRYETKSGVGLVNLTSCPHIPPLVLRRPQLRLGGAGAKCQDTAGDSHHRGRDGLVQRSRSAQVAAQQQPWPGSVEPRSPHFCLIGM